MTTVADTLGELDVRLWRVTADYLEAAHAKTSWAKVRRISVDQTSSRWGPSLCYQCAYLFAMVKAVEDTVPVNDFTCLDCLEDTLRRVQLGQDSRDAQVLSLILWKQADLSPTHCAGLLGAGTWRPVHGGYRSGRCFPERNDNGKLTV